RAEIIRERVSEVRVARTPKPNLKPVPALSHVALVASFPPRLCGIAAFAADVYAQLAAQPGLRCDVVAVRDGLEPAKHEAVRHVSRQDEPEDYVAAAKALNAEGVELVCVQHEFGIFGGDAGDYLLRFLEALHCPVVVTLHTVLQDPSPDQRRVVTALL